MLSSSIYIPFHCCNFILLQTSRQVFKDLIHKKVPYFKFQRFQWFAKNVNIYFNVAKHIFECLRNSSNPVSPIQSSIYFTTWKNWFTGFRCAMESCADCIIYMTKLVNKKWIYRQSPVKSPDIKNIIVVTLTFLFEKFPTALKKHT